MSRYTHEIYDEIEALERIEVHIATNQGTYGATEAGRKCGTGDPRFANREIYETVGGKRRETGPDAEDMPGRLRWINQEQMSRLRSELADLRKRAREIASQHRG